ncbi:porin [Jannaschia pohangensis]|uniref:Outer membrane protein OmpU n=1 Tax=Jannaschia pohangensis TaxID=390807 RepID=A0A1I3UB29_9RHOB|nr:porin [Jannaschia pohangensis]SFJ80105.1 outer membrane protein OmpU [Jannaschia pohangensis]
MKKVLFASTALVAFAGAASAEITITGVAEMGIFNADTFVSPGNVASGVTQFFTDIDVTFTMSGETDGGLTFGATVDLDENGAFAPATQGGEVIFISGAFGTLTMGDTDGALDWALTEVNFNGGSIADDETEHAGYNGNAGLDGLYDGQIARYDYSFGDFGVALSAELDDTNAIGNDDVLGIGFKYNLDLGGTTVGLGLGYQSASLGNVSVDTLGVSANASFGGGFSAGLSYVTYDNHVPSIGQYLPARALTPGFDTDHIGVGVGYSSGAISAHLNYGQYDTDAAGGAEFDGIGLSVGYDLGGGASVVFGYGASSGEVGGVDLGDVDTVSLGVSMSF